MQNTARKFAISHPSLGSMKYACKLVDFVSNIAACSWAGSVTKSAIVARWRVQPTSEHGRFTPADNGDVITVNQYEQARKRSGKYTSKVPVVHADDLARHCALQERFHFGGPVWRRWNGSFVTTIQTWFSEISVSGRYQNSTFTQVQFEAGQVNVYVLLSKVHAIFQYFHRANKQL